MLHQVVGQYFWVICLAVCLVNYALARRKLLKGVSIDGTSIERGLKIIKWFWLASTLPWLVMGMGHLSGAKLSVWDYFRPQNGNPWVIGWFASMFLLAIIFGVWVLFKGGAKDICEYRLINGFNSFGRETPLSENMVKLFAAVMPFWILFFFFVVTRLGS